jgi:hypothetical protein
MNQVFCTSRSPAETTRDAEFYAFQLFQSERADTTVHFVRELRVRWDMDKGRLKWDEEPMKSFRTSQEALEWYIRRKITLAKSGFIYPTRWPAPLRVPGNCRLIL